MGDINKLPKWARIELEKLRADNKSYQLELVQVRGESETNVHRINLLEAQPLPKDSIIEFKLDKGTVTLRHDAYGELDITTSSGFDTVISPKASNSFTLTFKEYPKR